MQTPLTIESLRIKSLTSRRQLLHYPADCDLLALPKQSSPQYLIGFACSARSIERALRLRYKVFNEELGEGLAESRLTGLDRDEFDDSMYHIVLIDRATDQIIGTYRIQSVRSALQHAGMYCAREYDLSALEPYFHGLVETGRACIAREHRNYATIIMLWKAIAVYMVMFDMRWLFGCCSLTTQDPDEGWRAMKTLRQIGALHEELLLRPTAPFHCGDPSREFAPELGEGAGIPKLFSAYLSLGSQVISLPAIDREFGTVDFLVMLDKQRVNFSSLLQQTT
jgi:putative hemolysin